jgi:regulator of sirC expression with transglutaminase-like and TPR domain
MTQIQRQPVRKSKKMLQVEQEHGEQLETLLPRLYNEMGFPAMVEELGLNKSTLWYWFLKIGMRIEKVAISSSPAS